MKKKQNKSQNKASGEPKPIVVSMTIYPIKHGVRKVLVSAAPIGEMPLVVGGTFQERYNLLDTAYAGVMKRDPQLVTIKEPKAGKSKSITAEVDDDTPEATDQLVSGESVPVSPITEAENLPAIEGDDVPPAAAVAVEQFEAQLNDLKSGGEVDDGEQD